MLKNYFKIARRNLLRNKGFSITNLLGLTIGMTCTLLILLWVKDEVSYDKFHSNHKNIYKVLANRDFKNQILTDESMVFPLAKTLENNIPQIKNSVVTTYQQSNVLSYKDTKLKKSNYTVSENFFNIFSWNFIKGNAATAIQDPSSIVLTASTAKSIFGEADAMDKIVRFDDHTDLKVTAIVEDPPANSTFQFEFIRPFNYADPNVQRNMKEWINSSWNVFVQTIPSANLKQIEKKVNDIKKEYSPEDNVSTYFLFPMSKWHLQSEFREGINVGGMIEYVWLFSLIAVIILLIACVNFMNLSTARSEKRSKEVGIRKTLGSDKKQLVVQFFFESLILTLIAFIFSIIAVLALLPSFNEMVDKQLSLVLGDPLLWIGAFVVIAFTGVVAGSYPAFYLSSFNPVTVLKGTFLAGKKAILPRRILVVGQFVISILLISATIIIYKQIHHVKNRDLGYNPDNLIVIPSTSAIAKNFVVIKQELLETGMISGISRSLSPMTEIWWQSPSPEWEGKPSDVNIIVTGQNVDVDFTKTMGIKVIEGADFAGMPSDSSKLMLNQAAVEAMGLKDPIGMKMRFGGREYFVSGITENVVVTSPYEAVDPMVMLYNPGQTFNLTIRLNENIPPQKALKSIESIFKKYNPAFPFEYRFVDQEFGRKFLTEELIGKLTNIFAGLAIFICCIGLAGLASFTIEKRLREIGIRKVLGATVQQLLMLISKEFLKLVLIAFAIAVPLTWLLMNNWLEKYTYHINISIWLFLTVGIIILLLTLAVVTLNTIKAAMLNPVKSLRSE